METDRTGIKPFEFAKPPRFIHCKDCEAWKEAKCKRRVPQFAIVGTKDEYWYEGHWPVTAETDGCFDGLQIVADCIPQEEE